MSKNFSQPHPLSGDQNQTTVMIRDLNPCLLPLYSYYHYNKEELFYSNQLFHQPNPTNSFRFVEDNGFKPLTPCVQGRCSIS